MKTVVTLDVAGRIVLPKGLRDALRLSPGDTLDIAVQGESLSLRPRRSPSPLQKKQGIWVFRTGQAMAEDEAAETLRRIRAQRDRENAGEGR